MFRTSVSLVWIPAFAGMTPRVLPMMYEPT